MFDVYSLIYVFLLDDTKHVNPLFARNEVNVGREWSNDGYRTVKD